MPKIQFDINAAANIAIDVAKYAFPVQWMEIFRQCFNQSKSVFHSGIK